jgi:hypothetical protein
MSEPLFPSSSAPGPEPVVDAAEEPTSRRTLLLIGGIGAAVLAAGGAYFFLNSGSGDEAPAASAPRTTQSAPAAKPTPTPTPTPTTKVVVRTANVAVTSRDPFKPLFPSAKAAPAASQAPSNPSTPAAPVVTPAPAPSSTGVPGTKITVGVAAINTINQAAQMVVNGKKYVTRINTPFAQYFTVYSIFNAQCVGVLFGDQSVPVCIGKPQTVTP